MVDSCTFNPFSCIIYSIPGCSQEQNRPEINNMDSNVVILFIIMFPFVYITFVILHHNSVSVWDWNVFPVTELGIRYSIDQSQIFHSSYSSCLH